jgi:hypothetical protein
MRDDDKAWSERFGESSRGASGGDGGATTYSNGGSSRVQRHPFASTEAAGNDNSGHDDDGGGGGIFSPQERTIIEEMGPPVVDWAPTDLLREMIPISHPHGRNHAVVTYHALTAGFHVLAPVGAAVGVGAYLLGLWPTRASPSAPAAGMEIMLQAVGASAFTAGCIGTILGIHRQSTIAFGGGGGVGTSKSVSSRPWNVDGVRGRAESLSVNFPVRVVDLSVFASTGLALGILLFKGGPTRVGLSPGWWGTAQALGLGVTAGSLSAVGCICANRQR